jgi:alpha-D-xyloside xylohydrolase
MSAQLNFNSWYLNNPPWLQYNLDKNNSNEFLPNAKELESMIRELLEFRMSLIPYLYATFSKYHFEGVPPFRALIMDYPNDINARSIDDEYLIGDNLLAAPFIDGASKREVYFPEGNWYDFNSGKKFEGNKTYTIEMSLDEIPLFVKEGTILPLAKPVQFITPKTVFDITCHVYGSKCQPTSLFEDNSYNNDFAKGIFNTITLSWDGKKGKVSKKGNYKGSNYRIVDWVKH